jgi:hypothetical protein
MVASSCAAGQSARRIRFDGDGIVAVGDQFTSFGTQWGPTVFEVFAEWVETNHPEDAAVTFDFDEDVHSDILAMYEVHTFPLRRSSAGRMMRLL